MNSGMYTEREVQCLKEGMGAVRSVLSGTDTEAKRRLLFYLDWYMDPYYKQDISGIKKDLKEMLEKVAVSPEEEDIIDDARRNHGDRRRTAPRSGKSLAKSTVACI